MCTYLSTKQQPPSNFIYKHMNFLVIYFPIFKKDCVCIPLLVCNVIWNHRYLVRNFYYNCTLLLCSFLASMFMLVFGKEGSFLYIQLLCNALYC